MARVEQSVQVRYLPPSERDTAVSRLDDPWIGDEGPVDAGFRRGFESEPLRYRGIAFDSRTTVVWDEDAVQVLEPTDAAPGVEAHASSVLLREFVAGPPALTRIDYLKAGRLLGSRYLPERSSDLQAGGAEVPTREGGHAQS